MFQKLEHASNPLERTRMYDKVQASDPQHHRRHSLSLSNPWDSYQWAMGTMMILIGMIFWGVDYPALHGNDRFLAYVWIALFAALWGSLVILMSFDPSASNMAMEKSKVKNYEQRLVLFCKFKGCQCYYDGKYRKHCRSCNKCITGFDHH